jgi:acyl-CoA dehydrogenase
MQFQESEEHALIRDAVRKVCADFPDDYWLKCDSEHRFPWEFYRALAKAG